MKLWQGLILVTLLWAALYLPFLGSNELRGEEARRVLPARTMLQTGDWMVPRIGGEEYASKPPLINWSIAAMFALTGVENEWTARMPSVLWLLAFALITTVVLAERFGVWRAVGAALFFLSAVGMLDKGRMAEIEAMYAAQTGIAYVLWAAWWAEGKIWRAYLLAGVFLGLGLLAKGPVHLFCFYGAVIPALWMSRRRIELVQGPHLASLAGMAAIFLPWLIANLRQVKAAEATTGAWMDQVAVRFSFAQIDWGEWAALPFEILKNFLPGSVFLLLLWKLPWRPGGEAATPVNVAREERWRCVIEGAKLTLLGGLILLSLSPEFRPRYAMPLFGVGAVVVGDLFRRLDAGEDPLAQRIAQWWKRLNRVGLVAVVVGGVLAMAVAALGLMKGIAWWHAWPGLAVAVCIGWGWRRLDGWQPIATSCAILAGAQILVFQFARPRDEVNGLYRPVARQVHQLIPEDGRTLVFLRPGHLRFLFYLRRPYREVTTLSGGEGDGAGYLAVRESDLKDGPVQTLLEQRGGTEIGRREIEGRKLVFFDLERN